MILADIKFAVASSTFRLTMASIRVIIREGSGCSFGQGLKNKTAVVKRNIVPTIWPTI